MVRIIFTRHGQTQWNIENRCQGQTDIKLTSKGLSQAKALAQRLKKYNLSTIYTSDLIRASDTAKEIQRQRAIDEIAIIKNPLLREHAFGDWEGLTFEEIEIQYKDICSQRDSNPHVQIPGGEKHQDLVQRGIKFVEHCLKNHDGETVLAVSHGGFLKALLHHYLELPWKIMKNNMYIENCSLTIFKVSKEKVVIERINDTAHFEDSGEMVEARH